MKQFLLRMDPSERPQAASVATVYEKYETKILEPWHYIQRIPGKGFRRRLMECFQQWLKVDEDTLERLQDVIDRLHNASLLIDDIEDNSKLRRGFPVAHSIYGIAATINAANYVYFKAAQGLLDLGSPAAMNVFVEELQALHQGQGLDIYWRDHNICPSEEEYRQMVEDKTGGLFRLGVRLMQVFATEKGDVDCIPLVNNLGLFFQILDDYQNLNNPTYQVNKGFCEDLTEGKYSFPIVHHIHTTEAASNGGSQVQHILQQRTEDPALKKYALQCIEGTKSLEYTRSVLEKLKNQIFRDINDIGVNTNLHNLVAQYFDVIVSSECSKLSRESTSASAISEEVPKSGHHIDEEWSS